MRAASHYFTELKPILTNRVKKLLNQNTEHAVKNDFRFDKKVIETF